MGGGGAKLAKQQQHGSSGCRCGSAGRGDGDCETAVSLQSCRASQLIARGTRMIRETVNRKEPSARQCQRKIRSSIPHLSRCGRLTRK